MVKNSQTKKFCSCITQVRTTIKLRPGQKQEQKQGKKQGKKQIQKQKESAAIGTCIKSILWSRGRTLRKFRCKGKKPFVRTQKKFKN
jgi:hypothetical protein